MTPPTPSDTHVPRPQLRVIPGGLAHEPRQEDDPAVARALLRRELDAAAALSQQLEDDELQITFHLDTAGGRVRVCLVDREGQAASEVPLAQVVSPHHLTMLTGALR